MGKQIKQTQVSNQRGQTRDVANQRLPYFTFYTQNSKSALRKLHELASKWPEYRDFAVVELAWLAMRLPTKTRLFGFLCHAWLQGLGVNRHRHQDF